METDGGGWLVFQRRSDGSENFYRNWEDYELGFGNISNEHWLGLIPLHRGHYELRIDLESWEGEKRYAKYNVFSIGDSEANYTLKIYRYSGDAGDSMEYNNGNMFSTKDVDNDVHNTHCAQDHLGAWWYKSCHHSNLNGMYFYGHHDSYADGINWIKWKGVYYSLKATEMKIRRV